MNIINSIKLINQKTCKSHEIYLKYIDHSNKNKLNNITCNKCGLIWDCNECIRLQKIGYNIISCQDYFYKNIKCHECNKIIRLKICHKSKSCYCECLIIGF